MNIQTHVVMQTNLAVTVSRLSQNSTTVPPLPIAPNLMGAVSRAPIRSFGGIIKLNILDQPNAYFVTGASNAQQLYPDLPTGGSYSKVAGYFVSRSVPVYQFSDLARTSACVAYAYAVVVVGILLPAYYLYLDAGLASQSAYYIYRYVLNAIAPLTYATGPFAGGNGATILVGPLTATPTDCWVSGGIPAPPLTNQQSPLYNPRLVQVSGGVIPVFT